MYHNFKNLNIPDNLPYSNICRACGGGDGYKPISFTLWHDII
jgi:hypothetical protein